MPWCDKCHIEWTCGPVGFFLAVLTLLFLFINCFFFSHGGILQSLQSAAAAGTAVPKHVTGSHTVTLTLCLIQAEKVFNYWCNSVEQDQIINSSEQNTTWIVNCGTICIMKYRNYDMHFPEVPVCSNGQYWQTLSTAYWFFFIYRYTKQAEIKQGHSAGLKAKFLKNTLTKKAISYYTTKFDNYDIDHSASIYTWQTICCIWHQLFCQTWKAFGLLWSCSHSASSTIITLASNICPFTFPMAV